MNKVILMGRLTADPETRQTTTGKIVVLFTIAVNRRKSSDGQQNADFIKCVAWEKTGEFISKYFTKGKMIAIDGELRTRNYKDNNGVTHYITEVLTAAAYFTGEKAETKQNTPDITYDDFVEIEDESDLPF